MIEIEKIIVHSIILFAKPTMKLKQCVFRIGTCGKKLRRDVKHCKDTAPRKM